MCETRPSCDPSSGLTGRIIEAAEASDQTKMRYTRAAAGPMGCDTRIMYSLCTSIHRKDASVEQLHPYDGTNDIPQQQNKRLDCLGRAL